MREIKFRAWFTVTKEMKNVAMSNLYTGRSSWLHLDPQPFSNYSQVKIMQYTGLKDKNGTEIYEGDLIKITNPYNNHEAIGVAEIVFSYDYDGGWVAESGDRHLNIGTRTHMVNVVGNKFENPELLEESK